MPAAVPFLTNNRLSSDASVEITAGTAAASLSTAEQNAKNRIWRLTAAANGANLPRNPYRAVVIVDNSLGSATAYLVLTESDNPASTNYMAAVPSGISTSFSVKELLVGTGEFAVVLSGASATACVVTERSFE